MSGDLRSDGDSDAKYLFELSKLSFSHLYNETHSSIRCRNFMILIKNDFGNRNELKHTHGMNLAAFQNAASGNSNLNNFAEHSVDQTLSEQLLCVQLLNVLEDTGPSTNPRDLIV